MPAASPGLLGVPGYRDAVTATFAGQFGPQPFLDMRGNALPGAVVTVYDVGTLTPVVLYTDRIRTAHLANPLPYVAQGQPGLDPQANATFYAEPGQYRVRAVMTGTVAFDDVVSVGFDPVETEEFDGRIDYIEALLVGPQTGGRPGEPGTTFTSGGTP